jgi:hypothetical protein
VESGRRGRGRASVGARAVLSFRLGPSVWLGSGCFAAAFAVMSRCRGRRERAPLAARMPGSARPGGGTSAPPIGGPGRRPRPRAPLRGGSLFGLAPSLGQRRMAQTPFDRSEPAVAVGPLAGARSRGSAVGGVRVRVVVGHGASRGPAPLLAGRATSCGLSVGACGTARKPLAALGLGLPGGPPCGCASPACWRRVSPRQSPTRPRRARRTP